MDAEVELQPGHPDRHAVLLPGGGYTVQMPLLWYAGQALAFDGWTLHLISWPDGIEPEQVPAVAARLIDRITAAAPSAAVLVIGKSLGTFAMPVAVERGLPGIWMTPVLTDPTIAATVRTLDSGHLLVGGTGDRMWDSTAAGGSDAQVLEIAGADHSMQLAPDLDRTLDAITAVTLTVSRFVSDLRDATGGNDRQ